MIDDDPLHLAANAQPGRVAEHNAWLLMLSKKQHRRLGPQEAAFLYFDRDTAPMNVGTVAIFEGAIDPERFTRNIESKLHLVPRYRQIAVAPPWNVGRPTWEYDPDFEISRHIQTVSVDAPVSESQLMEIASKLFEGQLDRRKPLWEMYLVPGLEGDRTGLVGKVHHCLIDGISGIELLLVTLEATPDPPPTQLPEEPYDPPPVPAKASLFADAVFDNVLEGWNRLMDTEEALVDIALGGDANGARAIRSALAFAIPKVAVRAFHAPFNRPLSAGRTMALGEVSFSEVRAIRKTCGGTVNDVVLASLGGAMGRYLAIHGEPSDQAIRVAVPVNVRREEERDQIGTRVSSLLVDVPLGIKDPIERLRVIVERTGRLKADRIANGVDTLGRAILGIPAPLVAMAGRVKTPPNTIANMFCTNVPGPRIPLYTVGHRLLAHYPVAPLLWDMGVALAVTSYVDNLHFSIFADKEAMPDAEKLKDLLSQSFLELRDAALTLDKSAREPSALDTEPAKPAA